MELCISGGREVNLRSMQAMGLYAANSMFVSDYLTTPRQAAKDDFNMITDLGFEITARDYKSSQLLARESQEAPYQDASAGGGMECSSTCGG